MHALALRYQATTRLAQYLIGASDGEQVSSVVPSHGTCAAEPFPTYGLAKFLSAMFNAAKNGGRPP